MRMEFVFLIRSGVILWFTCVLEILSLEELEVCFVFLLIVSFF